MHTIVFQTLRFGSSEMFRDCGMRRSANTKGECRDERGMRKREHMRVPEPDASGKTLIATRRAGVSSSVFRNDDS